MRQQTIQNYRSVIWARMFLLLPITIFATITFLTHLSRILDLRFEAYALCAGAATLISISVWILYFKKEIMQIKKSDTKAVLALVAIGLLGTTLASIYHRPNTDDPFYVSNAVYHLTYPTEKMGNEINFIYSEGKPILSVVALTSGAYEYAQALFAYLLNIEYLIVYHILIVAFVGFTIPISIFLLLSHYSTDSLYAVIGSYFFILILILMGDTLYSFGSHSFTRIFQGKSVLIASGIPFYSALSIEYLSNPTIRRWIYLLIAATAFSGLTTTTFFLLPMLALSLGLAYLLSYPLHRKRIIDLATYGMALVYPVIYGLYASLSTPGFRDGTNPLATRYPDDFIGSLQLFIDPISLITPIVTIGAIILVLLIARGVVQRFLLIWVGVIVILFLNPIVAPFWIKNVTSHYIYWRVFHLVPISSLVGVVIISIQEKLRDIKLQRKISLLLSASLLMIGLNFIPGFPSIYQQGGTIDFPRMKVYSIGLAIGRFIAARAPDGPMLAPPTIAGVTTMLEGRHPQLHLEKPYPLYDLLPFESAERRARASFFVGGKDQYDEDFRIVVDETPELVIIVINDKVLSEVEEFIASRGFTAQEVVDNYIIYWKN